MRVGHSADRGSLDGSGIAAWRSRWALPASAAVGARGRRARARRTTRRRRQRVPPTGAGHVAELAASLEPEDVLDRTLDAVVALPGVDAALVAIGDRGDGAADDAVRAVG